MIYKRKLYFFWKNHLCISSYVLSLSLALSLSSLKNVFLTFTEIAVISWITLQYEYRRHPFGIGKGLEWKNLPHMKTKFFSALDFFVIKTEQKEQMWLLDTKNTSCLKSMKVFHKEFINDEKLVTLHFYILTKNYYCDKCKKTLQFLKCKSLIHTLCNIYLVFRLGFANSEPLLQLSSTNLF